MNKMDKEQLILKEILINEDFTRKVHPYLKDEYFTESSHKFLFKVIDSFLTKYNRLPSKESLDVILDEVISNQKIHDELCDLIPKIFSSQKEKNLEWLIDFTEQFCKESAIYNALMESIDIHSGNNKKKTIEAIPEILKDALSVSFDTSIGHDYFEDVEKRFDDRNRQVEKIPFTLETFNKMTCGGIERKTLNCVVGGQGAGKSMFLSYLAAGYVQQGYNVLYITLELSEIKIADRIDAILLNLDMSDLKNQLKPSYIKRVKSIQEKVHGKLIIREFPTGSAHVGHYRKLMDELYLKKSFVPDVVIIDYLGISASSRIKDSGNSYTYFKSVAEEFRGLAVERNLAVWTASQFNRCLDPFTILQTKEGEKFIKDIKIGDLVLSKNGIYNTVLDKWESISEMYEIELESGKKIICSANHIFPTESGEKSINSGLMNGNILYTK